MTLNKKFIRNFLIFFLCFMILLSSSPTVVKANENVNFDYTNAYDDLKDTIDMEKFPFDQTGSRSVGIANFVEYCYSFRVNMQSNFGLYLYVYNPQQIDFDTEFLNNRILMAVSYDEDGNPNDYEYFDLRFLNHSVGNYYKLFYKFKIIDHESKDGKTIVERVNSNERRYDISGFEIATKGNANATEYGVGGTYKFSGYAKGYGPDINAESTFKSEGMEYLDYIKLDVGNTFWRSETHNKLGKNYQHQLDSVFFTVPNYFFEKYGKLQRIKAEWYEYNTKDIIVTSNKAFYNAVLPYVGIPVGELKGWYIKQNNSVGYGLAENYYYEVVGTGLVKYADWLWNDDNAQCRNLRDKLFYLLPTPNWKSIGEYDPYGDMNNVGDGSKNALLNYILQYDKSYYNGSLPIKNGTISADLFESDIDENRKKMTEFGKIQNGYSYYDFDADVDLLEWESYKPSEHNFLENVQMTNFWDALTRNYNLKDESAYDVSPITVLDNCDEFMLGSDENVAKNLYVNVDGASEIKTLYKEAKGTGKVVLFRFALSDYYSAPLIIDHFGAGSLGMDALIDGQAYRAVQSVFFNFDIIQLTFSKEGKYSVIPVVANPIDIVNNPTPPPDLGCSGGDLFTIFLTMLIFVILYVVITKFIYFIRGK